MGDRVAIHMLMISETARALRRAYGGVRALLAGFVGAGPCGEVTGSAVSTGRETLTPVAIFTG